MGGEKARLWQAAGRVSSGNYCLEFPKRRLENRDCVNWETLRARRVTIRPSPWDRAQHEGGRTAAHGRSPNFDPRRLL